MGDKDQSAAPTAPGRRTNKTETEVSKGELNSDDFMPKDPETPRSGFSSRRSN